MKHKRIIKNISRITKILASGILQKLLAESYIQTLMEYHKNY